MDNPPHCRPPRKVLGFADLVTAYGKESRYRTAARELADYHGRRLRVLADLFGCDFKPTDAEDALRYEPGDDPRAAHDRAEVVGIARDCLSKLTTVSGPFGYYMEGRPGPLEQGLLERNEANMSAALVVLQKRLRETFADSLRVLYPGIEKRKVPVTALVERGVPLEEPDPDEFW